MIPAIPLRCTACVVAGWIAVTAGARAGSEWFTRTWQTDDGLPNNYVSAIAPAPDGCLWITTRAGVSRFDGVHFTPVQFAPAVYKEDDNWIVSTHPDSKGNLWIVPGRGATIRLAPDFSQVALTHSNLPNQRPYSIVEDHDGGLWLAYPEVVCRLKDGVVTTFNPNDKLSTSTRFNHLVCDHQGNIWLSKGGVLALFQDGRFRPASKFNHGWVTAARTNGIWFTADVHLFKYEAGGRMQDVGAFLPASSHTEAWAVLEDRTGAVWIGTGNDGLYRYDGLNFEKVETSQSAILCLAEDREGNIWAGTSGGGLDRITRRAVRLEGLDNGSGPLIPLQSICEDARHVLWGATQNGLLITRTNEQWIRALTDELPPDGVITCVAADKKGAVWIGTRNRKLYRWFNDELVTWDVQKGFLGHTAIDLFATSNGGVWIGEYGLPPSFQYIHDGQFQNVNLPDRFRGRVTSIVEDVNHGIWVSTSSGGLWRVKGDTLLGENSLPHSITNRSILCLYPTSDGALWIGYDGSGLGRLKDGDFHRITTADGLYNDRISQIIADDDGWLWFGSGRGIFKVRRAKLEQALDGSGVPVQSIHYGPNEGLFSTEATSVNIDPYTAPTAVRSSDGRIWIPMRTGIASIDPKILSDDTSPPTVLLTGMTVDGRVTASYGNVAANPEVVNLKAMKICPQLPPSHRRLEFDFTALNFGAPENVHLQYKLDGLDATWNNADAERHAEYSRLTAGRYVFHVRACNGDGNWNESGTPLAFTVIPFIWQTWWFRVLTVTASLLFVIAAVRYISFRRLRWKLRSLEQEAALNRERARIARDIHDDLGGNLTQVKQLFELTSLHRASPEKVDEYVQLGLAVTNQGVQSLDETVWTVNPRNDTLPDLIDYIGQRTAEFLSTAGVQYHLDLPDVPPEKMVPAEVRHNLFFVVKEALNNIARHAHATEVRLQITVDDQALNVVIEDDGRGFEDLPDDPCADGLRNMRDRMKAIRGRFDVKSAPGQGTKIFLSYPWP